MYTILNIEPKLLFFQILNAIFLRSKIKENKIREHLLKQKQI